MRMHEIPKKDSQARKYHLVINNPLDVELPDPKNPDVMIPTPFTHDEIKARLAEIKAICYYCLADEIGLETQTPHTHIYFRSKESSIRFSTVKRRFPTAHIERAYNSSQANREYIRKEGKWADTEKQDTSIEGSFEEWGTIPESERRSLSGISEKILDMVQDEASDYEILQAYPETFLYLDKIQRLRQTLVEEEAKSEWRDLSITYLYGPTNTGKTRSVMEEFGYENVYRVTDYSHPWDSYRPTQDVVLFEEFRSSLPIGDMLVYLDGYPCTLKARYTNKQACFTKAYFSTNIPLEQQYPEIQVRSPETWAAFLRRIGKVVYFQDRETRITYNSVADYFKARSYFSYDHISDEDFDNLFNLTKVDE